MIEIRFQGRGGQGVVIASEILARSCFEEGRYSQAGASRVRGIQINENLPLMENIG